MPAGPMRVGSETPAAHPLSVQVIMKGDKEIVGTLRGFDDYVNMVMDVHDSVSNRCIQALPRHIAGPLRCRFYSQNMLH